VLHKGDYGNPDANVQRRLRMGLTVLVISVLEGTEQFGNTAIHKPQVAEFYQCWCFSATT
jgi:hypothetical protein